MTHITVSADYSVNASATVELPDGKTYSDVAKATVELKYDTLWIHWADGTVSKSTTDHAMIQDIDTMDTKYPVNIAIFKKSTARGFECVDRLI